VSLIQAAKADQAEGRLGMELVRIRALFEHLPPGAMVIASLRLRSAPR
jgi:DNA mismatch repair protein MutS2